ncbi:MAG: hypothetical protein JST10_11290 [Bacteroidetes bacterium]|nr:hypothetical protein [Bacteroidota bacterium]MBS1633145.1 hypothetical protein [Bacteroidota bacterium]
MKRLLFIIGITILSYSSYSQLNKEQESIKETFFGFLKFYQKNEKKFNSFRLYKGTGKENNPPYKIQWNEVNRYFAWLKTNVPYVGKEYIKNEKANFQYYDSCYKVDPEEEIAVGFDYDRWGGGQEEIVYLIKWHTDPKNKYEVIINGNTALLRIGASLWEGAEEKDRSWNEVPFVKEKGKWKMADNIYPFEKEQVP